MQTTPKYSLHKASGQARVRLNGKDVYLGVYGFPESREEFARVITEWRDRNGCAQLSSSFTVDQLALSYLDHAKRYYVKNGDGTDHIYKVRAGLRLLIGNHRGELVTDFSPRMLKGLQQTLIKCGRSRSYINDLIGVIKRCFKWGASEELVPVRIYDGLRTVDALRKGRSAARETEPVRPVAEADILAVLSRVSAQIKTMIELQRLTGMRPGEVLIMRLCDITIRTDGLWTYRPESHKTTPPEPNSQNTTFDGAAKSQVVGIADCRFGATLRR